MLIKNSFYLKKVYILLVVVYLTFLLINIRLVNLIMPLVILTSFINFKEGTANLKYYLKKNRSIFLILLILIIYQFFRALIGDDLGDKRIGFLGLLIGSFICLFRLKNLDFLFNSIIVIIFGLTLAGVYNIYQYYISTDYFTMSTGGHIDSILIVARPYLGFVLNIGIILSAYQFTNVKNRIRFLYLGSAITFLLYMMFIAIRIQLVSLACIGIIYFIFYNKMRVLYKIGVLGLLVSLCIGIFSVSPTLKSRFEVETLAGTNMIDKLAEKEPRVIIWRCSSAIAKEESFNPIIGVGNIDIIDQKLAQCYDDATHNNSMREYFLDALFNTHNQFIEYYLLSGVVGVLLLLSLFVRSALLVRKNFFSIAILVCLFNFCLVENLLDRQLGAYLFGFSLFLIMSSSKQKAPI